jgi:hypothetical protein
MPLRALLAERDIVAPLLDDAEWEALRVDVKARRALLALRCCGASAFPRVSKLGTRHFVHRRSDGCPGSGETFQHLWLKAEILAACDDAGWPAQPEVAGEGWRADVLASRERSRVAFEVQWSRQDEPATRFRQERYGAAGIRACWLHRGEPPAPSRELPVFQLVRDDEQVAVVQLSGRSYGVREFVGLLLRGKVRFSETQTVRLRVSFIDMDCWKCRKPAHIYFVRQHNRCGWAPNSLRYADVDEFDPAVLALVRQWLAGEGRGTNVKLGEIKPRYSRTMETSYTSFGCPHCNSIFGDWFVREAVMEAHLYDQEVAGFDVERQALGNADQQGHWCLPADGVSYCSAGAARQAA